MKKSATAAILVLAAVTSATSALAFPQINVIGSETISAIPPRYKTTFTIDMVGYIPPGAYYGFQLTSSGQGAPVAFYGAGGPGYPWSTQNTTDRAAYYVDGGGIHGHLQFSVTTDQQVPCVTITFLDGLLFKTPIKQTQNNYVINGCLAVDMPTPAAQTSWGGLKAFYR